ncbi:MAG: hypothetical protein J7641_24370 [Cyanobacteria bacterium SID2]|nr:hypothetical protein [Cyanobacteria bacterium SID2]MBP0003237.1 hypothetical protein [Cyanobacteria bacterium SBC]
MNAFIEQRMRLLSHAKIRRQIEHYRQRVAQRTGDRRYSCQYYANSAYLLCAVNPSGPCSTCRHYKPKGIR